MAEDVRTYRLELAARVRKYLRKMDRFDARILASWLKNNLDGSADPRALGKMLTAGLSGE